MLLEEAHSAGLSIEELYSTPAGYEATPRVRELDARGIPTFIVDPQSAATISDLETPSGILAVAPVRLEPAEELFRRGGPLLVLADIGDPANAGTLLRSADAFGCRGVVFGPLGVDPYHPKVVRGAMGALFRLGIAVAEPQAVAEAAAATGVTLLGLCARGVPLHDAEWTGAAALVLGNERHGLGRWESICAQMLAIPMKGRAESLSAGVAGSIALYEASRRLPRANA